MAIYFIAFLSLSFGIIVLLKTNVKEICTDVSKLIVKIQQNKKPSMKKQIERSLKKNKMNGFLRIINESKSVLELSHRMNRLPRYTMASVLLALVGILLSLLLNNYFLLPVMSVGFALLPWLYVQYNAAAFIRQLNVELESTLSIITISYLRSDNIITAIRENIDYINYPLKEIFEKFLIQSRMINPDITQLLEKMKKSINNEIYQEWVNQIILCQNNRTLKSTLQPIVSKLSEIRIATGKLSNYMYEPMKVNVLASILLLLFYPLIRFMNVDWYNSLMYTAPGQLIVTFSFVALMISLIAAVRKTRPVEYRR